MELKTAAAYIRVSTDDQLEYSPDSQLRAIRDYANRNGFRIPEEHIYIDEGISGRRAEKRPAFMSMITAAKTRPKPFDAILLWKFSRFARSRQDSIVYKSMLRRQLGIDVLSVSESLGDDGISLLVEALIEAMDEYYSVNLGEEVRRGMTEKARRGEPLAVPPFGYALINKRLVVVPDEAEIIRFAFTQFARGHSVGDIAKTLNSMGVLTHRGCKIEARTVEYWINNPVYIGKIRWTPTGKTRRNFNNPDSIVADGTHQPIISPELWGAVKSRLDVSARRRHTGSYSGHWLTGLLRCGLCGRSMANIGGYYYCGGKARGLCPGVGGLKACLAERLTVSAMSVLTNLSDVSCYLSAAKNDGSGLLDRAHRRLARIEEAYESGADSLKEYKANKARIISEITELEASLLTPPASPPFFINKLSDLLLSDKIPNEKKNAVLRAVICDISVTPSEFVVNVKI